MISNDWYSSTLATFLLFKTLLYIFMQVKNHSMDLSDISLSGNFSDLMPSIDKMPGMDLKYCYEEWPSDMSRNIYDIIFLCLVYVIPGGLTVLLYARVGRTLWATDQALSRQNSYVANEGKMVRNSLFFLLLLSIFQFYSYLGYQI